MNATAKEWPLDRFADLMDLSQEEFYRFLPDLLAWFELSKLAKAADAEVLGLVWLDDGRKGEIHSVELTIKETGEKQLIAMPGFDGEPAP